MKMTLGSLLLGVTLIVAGCAIPEAPVGETSPGPSTLEQRANEEDRGSLSLATAVAMALRRNVDLRVEALNSALSREDVTRSHAIYDPFLTASATGGERREPQADEPDGIDKNASAALGVTQLLPSGATVTASTQSGVFRGIYQPAGSSGWDHSSSVGVVVTQPLLKNAGKQVTEVNIVLAQNAYEDSLEHYRAFAADTILAVISAYNKLYALRQTLDFKKASLDTARKVLETTKSGTQARTLQPIDLTNAEYGVAQRLRDLVNVERDVRDQEASLRYLIGMSTGGEVVPTDPPTREDPGMTQDQALQTALKLRPDLKQLRSALKSAELQSRLARNQTLPDLSVVVGAGLDGTSGTFGDNLQQMGDGKGFWSAGLKVTMPLGNTAAGSDYRKSRIREEQARAQIEALSWKIRNEVESDLRSLISARLELQVAEAALAQARQRLAEYRLNNQAGSAATQDVLNAESDLTAAQSTRIDAVGAYAEAVTKLWRDTGELPDRLGVKIAVSGPGSPENAGESLATGRSGG